MKQLCTNVPNYIICNSQEGEAGKCPPTDWQINSLVHPYDGIIFSHEKGWNTDMCHSTDRPWKLYAKWRKQDMKDNTVYDGLMQYPE